MNIKKIVAVSSSELPNHLLFDLPIKAGTPFLVDRDSGKVLEPVLRFILETHRKDTANTSDARCEDLKDWFIYLYEFEIDWLDADSKDLKQYQQIMQQTYSNRHEPYAVTTIKRRTSSIIKFYNFWKNESLYKQQIENKYDTSFHLGLDKNPLSHLGSTKVKASSAYANLKSPTYLINVMTPNTWSNIASKLGSEDTVARLIWETALQTGMRIHEVLNLTKYEIQALTNDPDEPARTQPLKIIGKGAVARNILLPNWLIGDLNVYIENERRAAVVAAHKKYKRKYKEPTALFINKDHRTHVGKAIIQRTALRYFESAVKSAGYIDHVKKIDPESGEVYYSQKSKYSGHSTRHSFAIWTYYVRKEQGDSEPWKYIQTRLGHKSLQTTLDIYLSAADDFEALISDRLLWDFRELAEGKHVYEI